ncbi:MAG: molybdate ABC transporter substrate-binding protein [Chitinophagaceae bacterium]|nr:molybdate ABC transporter substrate-binding protein [Oligoflexus sp.]
MQRSTSLLMLACALMSMSPILVPALQAETLTLAAAASLQDALAAMKPELNHEFPGTIINISAAASGTIQQQITQGAPIDVYMSAAAKSVHDLDRQKLLSPGTLKVFLYGDLVLIAPAKSQLKTIAGLVDVGIKRIAIGEPRVVPAGEYAKQTLTQLKLYDRLASKYVFGKDVRQVLSYVARGEVEAGFVYKSDLESPAAKGVKIVEAVSKTRHEPIEYCVAVVASSKQQEKAKQLLAFLAGPKAALTWEHFGFRVPTFAVLSKGQTSAPH